MREVADTTRVAKTFEDEHTPREKRAPEREDKESAGLRKLYEDIVENVRGPLFEYSRWRPRNDTMLRADLAIAMHAAGDEHAADVIREAEKLIDTYNFGNDRRDYEEYDNNDIAQRERAIAIAALVRARGIIGSPDPLEEYRPYGRTEDGSDGGSYYHGPSLRDAYDSMKEIENPGDKAEALVAIAEAEAMNWKQGAFHGNAPTETLQSNVLQDIRHGLKTFNLKLLQLFKQHGLQTFHGVIYHPYGNMLPVSTLIETIKRTGT